MTYYQIILDDKIILISVMKILEMKTGKNKLLKSSIGGQNPEKTPSHLPLISSVGSLLALVPVLLVLVLLPAGR